MAVDTRPGSSSTGYITDGASSLELHHVLPRALWLRASRETFQLPSFAADSDWQWPFSSTRPETTDHWRRTVSVLAVRQPTMDGRRPVPVRQVSRDQRLCAAISALCGRHVRTGG